MKCFSAEEKQADNFPPLVGTSERRTVRKIALSYLVVGLI